MMRRIVLLLAVLLIVAAGMTWREYRNFAAAPLTLPVEGERLLVERGTTVRAVIEQLVARGHTEPGWRWRLLTRLEPVTIQAGEYLLPAGLTPRGLLALLASGEVIRYRFTIVEGWTFRQLLDALGRDPVLVKLPELPEPGELLRAIDPELGHPEGWFLPETYQFVRGDGAIDLLRRAHRAMQQALEATWQERDPELPLETPYELLTLASIVEKESSLESERRDIAGVFVRRLQQGWRLETDPTVIYGLGETFDGDIRRRDLETDSPYNTYRRHGLPPTPIALPGISSLQAAAHPADGTAMFFVASGQGGHVFSDTLEEHNAAVRAMLRRQP
ncbi:MAG: endolytic transglycosylase MltG [Xanthomonadales bacterium]|nr:endolytic transglycosylase MltG [Xanthomonadales bacterium]